LISAARWRGGGFSDKSRRRACWCLERLCRHHWHSNHFHQRTFSTKRTSLYRRWQIQQAFGCVGQVSYCAHHNASRPV